MKQIEDDAPRSTVVIRAIALIYFGRNCVAIHLKEFCQWNNCPYLTMQTAHIIATTHHCFISNAVNN